MTQQTRNNSGSPAACLIFGAGAWYAYINHTGPVMQYGQIQPMAALAFGVAALCSVKLTAFALSGIAGQLHWKSRAAVKNHKAQERWATWRDIQKEITAYPYPAPFWGVYKPHVCSRSKPLFIDYASNAVTFGPAGSGKGVCSVIPNILALYHCSKIVIDFKVTNYPITKDALEKRGERNIMINLGGVHEEIIGKSACFNPLDLITLNFETPGHITRIIDLIAAMCMQILPEPPGSGSDNGYWRDGSRDFIAITMLYIILIKHRRATLGDVLDLLSNRAEMHKSMLWMSGTMPAGKNGIRLSPMDIAPIPAMKIHEQQDVENFIRYAHSKALSTAQLLEAKDSKAAESFLSQAVLALQPYNISGTIHKVMQESSFDARDLKSGDHALNIFIGVDNSSGEQQMEAAGLVMWTLVAFMKQHKNKRKPVYIIGDETTNYKLESLPSLQTFGREYGIKWHGYIQSISAYKEIYGENAVSTLLSECEIKQFLPGQRSPEMLDLIEKELGNISYISRSHNKGASGDAGQNMSEDIKPLMDRNAVRRCRHGILIVRQCPPIKTRHPSLAEITPWRRQQGINPMFGKPFLKRVKLRIRERKGTIRQRFKRYFKRRASG